MRRLSLFQTSASLLILSAAAALLSTQAIADEKPAGSGEIYELRTYTTPPGKLSALHKRFRDHTMRLFEKHGMRNVIYWTPADKENTLVYVIAHKSRDAAKKSWKAFIDDPVWKKAYKASKSDGPLVTNIEKQFLNPTDYSPMK